MNLAIDRDYLRQTLIDLVQINSTNPSLSPDGAGEAEIAAYVSAALQALSLEVTTLEPEPGRVSVVGTRPGSGGGRSLMLNAHTDTVGVEGMAEPFSGDIRAGKLYGRGAIDMKGSLAACLAATKALVEAGITMAGDLLIAAVADEEYASLGTAEVIKHFKVDGAIVTEPTDLTICLAHKGFVWLEVETLGRAAHGSRFSEGIDANMRMGRFLAQLDGLEQELRARPGHPLLGPPSLHAAMLHGGTELSAYAARCQLQIERRVIPAETEAQVVAELQQLIDRLAASDPTFKATLKSFFARNAFEVALTAPIVQILRQSAQQVLGYRPEFSGHSAWMDSALLAEAGVETVVVGPTGAGLHSAEEWVALDSVAQLAEILALTAVAYCKGT